MPIRLCGYLYQVFNTTYLSYKPSFLIAIRDCILVLTDKCLDCTEYGVYCPQTMTTYVYGSSSTKTVRKALREGVKKYSPPLWLIQGMPLSGRDVGSFLSPFSKILKVPVDLSLLPVWLMIGSTPGSALKPFLEAKTLLLAQPGDLSVTAVRQKG